MKSTKVSFYKVLVKLTEKGFHMESGLALDCFVGNDVFSFKIFPCETRILFYRLKILTERLIQQNEIEVIQTLVKKNNYIFRNKSRSPICL